MVKFMRKWHRWISIIILLPFVITLITGILLLFRGNANWISPKFPETSGELQISFDEILRTTQAVSAMEVTSWKDVNRIQVAPAKGSIVVRSNNNYQIQIDGQSGIVVGEGPLRTPLFVSLHEGTFWAGKAGRFIIALPMALSVLFLAFSGIVLFFQPLLFKRALQKKAQK